jgi:hypothetical protein
MEDYMEKSPKKFRYERKYIIARTKVPQLLSELFQNGYHKIFNTRKVNNLYYDDYLLNSYYENIDGLSDRKKYRVRWYGMTYSKSIKKFEIKIKSEFLNRKEAVSLGSQTFTSPIESNLNKINNHVKDVLQELSLNTNVIPVLLNNYTRNYYKNKIKNVRVTIDKDLRYYSIISKKNLAIMDKCIIEFKYSNKDFFAVNNMFDLKLNKSSKYVDGTQQTMNL